MKILEKIQSVGGKAYYVGGYVRDKILGINSKDIDVEVFGLSYEKLADILSRFGKVDIVGKSFGVAKISFEGIDYDFSLPRRDSKTGVSHKDFLIEVDHSMTIEEAASRRDFTINSISMDIDGNIIDPFGGVSDLKNGILQPTSEAFKEDVLRFLRGGQFSARFNMVAHPILAEYLKESFSELNNLPKERIWGEFQKLSRGKYFSRFIQYMTETGLSNFFPELNDIFGVKQEENWHPEGTVDIHTGLVMDYLGIIGESRIEIILACLCHDFGKPLTTEIRNGKITSHGHEKAGGPIARSFLERIGCPPKIIAKVIPLVENHMVFEKLSDKAIRKLAERLMPANIEELSLVLKADKSGRPPIIPNFENITFLIERAAELGCLFEKQKPLFKGQDLIDIGLTPGKHFNKILKDLYKMQMRGTINRDSNLSKIIKGL